MSSEPSGVPGAESSQLSAYLWSGYIYQFRRVCRSRWIVVDINDPAEGGHFKRYVRKYESDGGWRFVLSSQGVGALQKRSSF